jgi:hypothetical protein
MIKTELELYQYSKVLYNGFLKSKMTLQQFLETYLIY